MTFLGTAPASRGAVSLLALAAATIAAPAAAQDTAAGDAAAQGNDIIVTASKRATTVQDVPFSINAQTA